MAESKIGGYSDDVLDVEEIPLVEASSSSAGRRGPGRDDEEEEEEDDDGVQVMDLGDLDLAGATMGGAPQSKNLIIRFTEYAYKILNEDMDDFFEDHVAAFDQDDSELDSGKGETLEQYDVYMKYIDELEKRFDDFSAREGYASTQECFVDIKGVIEEDEAKRKQSMSQLASRLRAMQERWSRQFQRLENGEDENDSSADAKSSERSGDAKAEKGSSQSKAAAKRSDSKGGEENADSGADLADELAPIMLFFQPMSMDNLLNQVMTLTEYTTFSAIMRAKVRQRRFLRTLEMKASKQIDEDMLRRKDLGAFSRVEVAEDRRHHGSGHHGPAIDRAEVHLDPEVLIYHFEKLIDRVCDLTPDQKEIQDETRKLLDIRAWKSLIRNERITFGEDTTEADSKAIDWENSGYTLEEKKGLIQRIVMTAGLAFWRLVSFEEQMNIRNELNLVITRVMGINDDHDDAKLHRSEALFLNMAHQIVNDIERRILAVLREYEAQQKQRRDAHKKQPEGRPGRESK